jgi:hypothetical protein
MTEVGAQTRMIDNHRHYVVVDDDGVRWDVPSVSTVKSLLGNPALTGWDINRHISAAYTQRDVLATLDSEQAAKSYVRSIVRADTSAVDYGNDAHRVAESILLGRPMPDPLKILTRIQADQIAGLVEEFVRIFQVEPVHVEQAVVRMVDGRPVYAGTLDLAARMTLLDRRVLAVVDWKSGASGLWPGDALSTGGYQAATHLIDHRTARISPLPEVFKTSVLVHVRHTGYSVHEIDAGLAPDVLAGVATVLQWKGLGRSVIGPDLTEDPRR